MRVILLFIFCSVSFMSIAQVKKLTKIKSPEEIPVKDDRIKIFLGGTIDMGKSDNWQAAIESELSEYNIIILNPRRDNWNKDWKPVSTDLNFRTQVEWELAALEASNIIVMYLAPDSQSPISLLELGLYARTNKLMVVCPDGYWRKGNVDIVAERYNIKNYKSISEMIYALKSEISKKK